MTCHVTMMTRHNRLLPHVKIRFPLDIITLLQQLFDDYQDFHQRGHQVSHFESATSTCPILIVLVFLPKRNKNCSLFDNCLTAVTFDPIEKQHGGRYKERRGSCSGNLC